MRFSVIALLTCAVFCSLNLSQAVKSCDTDECVSDLDPVWASDGNLCLGFRNACYLASANCDRQNSGKDPLEEISKDECQSSCPDSCPDDDSPVCGYTDEQRRTFANSCEMDKYSCESGTPYELYGDGPCSWD